MVDLGRKIGDMMNSGAVAVELDEDAIRYPSVYIDHLEADKELKDISLGQMVTLKGKVVSKKLSEGKEGKTICLDVEVHELSPSNEKSDDDDDEKEDDEPKNHREYVSKSLKESEDKYKPKTKEKENYD